MGQSHPAGPAVRQSLDDGNATLEHEMHKMYPLSNILFFIQSVTEGLR